MKSCVRIEAGVIFDYINRTYSDVEELILYKYNTHAIIEYKETQKRIDFISKNKGFMNGAVIIKKTKEHVIERINNNQYILKDIKLVKNSELYYKFNENLLLTDDMHKAIYAIDINNCYWTTLCKIGAIDKAHFNKYLVKKEWKQARNASVGSFATKTKKYLIRKGNIVSLELVSNPLEPVRSEVILHVYSILNKLYNFNVEHIIGYYVDCFFVINDINAQKIQNELSNYGYETKTKIMTYKDLYQSFENHFKHLSIAKNNVH